MRTILLLAAAAILTLPAAEEVGRIDLRLVEEGWLGSSACLIEIGTDAITVTVRDGGRQVHRERRILPMSERRALVEDLLASTLLDPVHAAAVAKPALVLTVAPPADRAEEPRERSFSAATLDRLAGQGAAKRFFDRVDRLTD